MHVVWNRSIFKH